MNDDIRAEIQRQTRPLRVYATLMTAVAGVLSLAAFQGRPARTAFQEIDVERINIVEPDGKLRMVSSNRPRSIGPIYKGKPFGFAGGGRLRFDSAGRGSLDFLDDNGRVTFSVPDSVRG